MTTTLIRASCHCGLNKFQIPLITANLPKPARMCHCNTCRHSTGTLCVFDPRMDGEPLSSLATADDLIPGDLTTLSGYDSRRLTRFFCKRCSGQMFVRTNVEDGVAPPGKWAVHWGVLEEPQGIDGIFKISKHIWIGDTLDGGIATALRSFGGVDAPPLGLLRNGLDVPENELSLGWQVEGGYKNPERLPLYCACGAVQFYLTRPTREKYLDNTEGMDASLTLGKTNGDPVRFKASHCLCNSCRQCTGSQITSWITVLQEHVLDATTNAQVNLTDPDKRPNALKQYISSEGCRRENCSTCGAAVFWWRQMKDGEYPHIDVAAGLIDQDASGGVRAESWIAWKDEVSFLEFSLSKVTADALREGVKLAHGVA